MIDRGEGNFRVDRKGRRDDEKELLFFVSNEYDDQIVDTDALTFDPCHQNLLSLLDKLMLATGIFITMASLRSKSSLLRRRLWPTLESYMQIL